MIRKILHVYFPHYCAFSVVISQYKLKTGHQDSRHSNSRDIPNGRCHFLGSSEYGFEDATAAGNSGKS